MTPDDKRRVAEIRDFVSPADTQTDRVFLLRLLDEAIAERDAIYEAAANHEKQAKEAEAERDSAIAAMEAYAQERDAAMAVLWKVRERASPTGTGLSYRIRWDLWNEIGDLIVAHSAATKPTEEVSG